MDPRDGETVLVRREALTALLKMWEGYQYGPGGYEPTPEQQAAGIGTLVTAEHVAYLNELAEAAEGHERHIRLAINGETSTGVCAACGRYAAMADVMSSAEGR